MFIDFGFGSIFKRFGVSDVYFSTVGSQNYMRDLAGLSIDKIYLAAKELIKQAN